MGKIRFIRKQMVLRIGEPFMYHIVFIKPLEEI
jgi:hypothetical protein